jgi:hypothetical protein
VHPTGAVVDVGQHHDGDPRVERGEEVVRSGFGVGVEQLQLEALRTGQRVGDVEVGRKVAALGDDEPALGRSVCNDHRCGRGQHLEQIHRGRIAHYHLAGTGADERPDTIADAPRQIDPAGAVPAADQPAAPLGGDDLGDPRRGGRRQGAERVAVQVDEAARIGRGQIELAAQRSQRVGDIEGQASVSGGDRHRGRERCCEEADAESDGTVADCVSTPQRQVGHRHTSFRVSAGSAASTVETANADRHQHGIAGTAKSAIAQPLSAPQRGHRRSLAGGARTERLSRRGHRATGVRANRQIKQRGPGARLRPQGGGNRRPPAARRGLRCRHRCRGPVISRRRDGWSRRLVALIQPMRPSTRYSINAFCTCRRFSASSQTTERGPSITAASTSSPR